MFGHNDDLLLRLNEKNCPAFGNALVEYDSVLQQYIQPFKTTFFPHLAKMFGYRGVDFQQAVQMCQYLEWADLHNVDLDITYSSDDLSQCSALESAYYKYVVLVDDNLSSLGAMEFMKYLHDNLATYVGQMQFQDSLHFKKHLEKRSQNLRPEMKLTDAEANPLNYYFLMTEQVNMKMFLAALTPQDLRSQYYHWSTPSIPSSTLIFEVVDNSGDITLNALFNDQYIPIYGCESGQNCKVQDVLDALNKQILITDVPTACKNSMSSLDSKMKGIDL